MTSPASLRPRVPSWLWVTLVVTALLAGLVLAARGVVANARADERGAVLREADAEWNVTLTAQRAAWGRELDSLRLVVAGRDSLAVVSASEARGAIAALRERLAVGPITLRETVLVAAADSAARMCTAALDDCAAFRAVATRTLAVADSAHRTDSTAARVVVFALVGARDSLHRTQRALAHAPTWRTVGTASATSASVGALLCLVFCR